MPRPSKRVGRGSDSMLEELVNQIDQHTSQSPPADTVPTGFPSLDKVLPGAVRQKELIVLAGDVGSGKSALALEVGIRAAAAQIPTLYLSGEMSPDRVLERALAIEGRSSIDELRQGRVGDSVPGGGGGGAPPRG